MTFHNLYISTADGHKVQGTNNHKMSYHHGMISNLLPLSVVKLASKHRRSMYIACEKYVCSTAETVDTQTCAAKHTIRPVSDVLFYDRTAGISHTKYVGCESKPGNAYILEPHALSLQ